jgi:hypothetical protein
MYDLSFDADHGILQLTVSGFFLPEAIDRFEQDFRAAVADARARSARLRFLADAREAMVLAAEVSGRVQALNEALFDRPDDLCATVVGSALAKIQARRLFETESKRTFLSIDAARMWLTAYAHEDRAAA